MISSNKKRILYITTSDFSKDVGGTLYTKSNISVLKGIFNVKVVTNIRYKRFNFSLLNKILAFIISVFNRIPPHINYHSHEYLYKYKSLLIDLNYNYDYIFIENLQLFNFLKIIKRPVIFISQNLESNLVYSRYNKIPHYFKNKIYKRTKKIELKFSSIAKGVISISLDESSIYQKYNKNCFTLPPTFCEINKTSRISNNEILTLGFLGSSHWNPNLIAFKHLFTNVLPILNVNCKIIVAGSRWESVYQKLNIQLNSKITVVFLGYVENLSIFWSSIHMLIAPITTGAGINIKVCESIFNNINVVGYRNAFRGLPIELINMNYIAKNSSILVDTINNISLDKLPETKTLYFDKNENIKRLSSWLHKLC